MKTNSWLLNRQVLSALCATPLLLGSALAYADEAAAPAEAVAPAAEVAPAAVEAAAPAAPAEPAPPYTLTFNLGLYTQYMFRGVALSDGPALQGGIDWHTAVVFIWALGGLTLTLILQAMMLVMILQLMVLVATS